MNTNYIIIELDICLIFIGRIIYEDALNDFSNKVVYARVWALYDIENDTIIDFKLVHYRAGEREIAEELINERSIEAWKMYFGLRLI